MDDCFLCAPDHTLIFAKSLSSVALSGLGPVVEGYSVVATRAHIRSYADAPLDQGVTTFAEKIRSTLIARFGSCVMTEHGRLPVCARPAGTEEHCFHAHFLLFPGAPNIVASSGPHFEESIITADLGEALDVARRCAEYFLVSATPKEFVVMSRPRDLMRQFARYKIAEAIGKPELADWVQNPQRPRAEREAATLRKLMPDEF